jgi:hypothetical protein
VWGVLKPCFHIDLDTLDETKAAEVAENRLDAGQIRVVKTLFCFLSLDFCGGLA